MESDLYDRSAQAARDSEFIIEEIKAEKKASPLLVTLVGVILTGGLLAALLVGIAV